MKPESSNIPLPQALDEWLAERTDADRRALEDVWARAGDSRTPWTDADQSRKAEVWMSVRQKMDESKPEELPRPRLRLVKPAHAWRWVAVAAAIALLFGVAYVFRPITVEAPRGGFAQVTLPDGSSVELNSESSLTYGAHFFNGRTVHLEGEAFFEVTKSDAPFVVETFNARTTVLGTSFNVRARPDEAQANTSVAVATGRVQVAARSGRDVVVLRAGQLSFVNVMADMPTTPMPVTLERRLAWRTGGLAFTDQSFALIFNEIERRYDVEIEAPEEVLSESYSFYVNAPESAESVLSDLARAEGFRYRATSQGYEVYLP